MGRLDLAALTQRVGGARWRRFRAEACIGQHGQDLVAPHWWTRWAYPIAWVLWLLFLPVVPVGVIAAGASGGYVLLSLLWPVSLGVVGILELGWGRRDFWGPRARQRYRLTELARTNAFSYEPVATPRRPAAHIFAVPPTRVHSDRFETPRFVVGNYEEIWDDGPEETEAYRHGYAVFRLRESFPRTLVARTMTERPKQLKDVEPVPGPDGRQVWSTKPEYPLLRRLLESGVVEQLSTVRAREIEIVGDELFVLRRSHFQQAQPQLWDGLESMAEALAPFLAPAVVPGEHHQVAVAPAP